MNTELIDLGISDYVEAHAVQLQYVENLIDGSGEEAIIVTEHRPVFTLGKNGGERSLLMSRPEIEEAGVAIVDTERGGDVTYHGPGQIVVYPILHLRRRGMSVAEYIDILEQIMIDTAATIGVCAWRDPRNRGVWVGDSKLGSIGIRVRRSVSFHGLALNVNMASEHFSWIQPCGLSGVGITSLARELDRQLATTDVKPLLCDTLIQYFG